MAYLPSVSLVLTINTFYTDPEYRPLITSCINMNVFKIQLSVELLELC